MSKIDTTKGETVQVQELMNLPSSAQAEIIADHFAEISAQYQPLDASDITIPEQDFSKPLPLFEPFQIHTKISKMKKKSATIEGDIPWKILREFSAELANPLSNIFNSCTLEGSWPEEWKYEYVTPVPKVHPPQTTDDLRKISLTKNLSKLYEALLADIIIHDIQPNTDKAQYGNRKGLSTTHYLVNMINTILTILDTNNTEERYAIVAQLIDWSKAFDRQDHKLGIEAFIRCGVRSSLIPILVSFFQSRKMTVKWQGVMSSPRDLPGGGPQGSTFGLLEYDVNSDSNANHVETKMKYKFVDDLSILDKINLVIAALCSYYYKNHVPSDIGVDQKFLPAQSFNSQNSLNLIQNWTKESKSKLNVNKSKIMIFNFTEDQFATRLYLENTLLETITETKLLGTVITSDLKWHNNTHMITCKAYKRMCILQNLSKFKVPLEDMIVIYILYIRSVLEQNCQVWHYSLSIDDSTSLERVQKVACRIILKDKYLSYEHALELCELETLQERRKKLCLKFAKKCTQHPQAASMFPLNKQDNYSTRFREKYYVQPASTERLKNSAIPQLQRALNEEIQRKQTNKHK